MANQRTTADTVSLSLLTDTHMADVYIVEKSVDDLEKEITCPACQDHYTDPKVLPCLHYYCKQCIYRLALRTGLNKPFSCPKCRRDATLPQGDVDKLPTAFFINRMKELHSKLEKAHDEVDAKCELCSGDNMEAFCQQCAQFICKKCIEAHQRMEKSFPGHKIFSFEELKEGGAKEIVSQECPFQTCRKHKEPMKMCCFDCNCLICHDCTIIDHPHPEHNYEFVKIAVPEMKKKLIQHLKPLKKVRADYSHAVKKIQTTKSEIEAQGDSVAKDIEKSFEEFHTIIENRKQELLKEAKTKVMQKLKHLSVQEKSLSTFRAVVQGVIKYTQQSLEYSAEDEVVCMHAQLKNQIDREIEEHCKEGRSLDPVEEVDIGVELSCTEELKQLCQTKAKVIQLPIEYLVSGDGMKTAEINKISEFSVKTELINGKHPRQKCDIECHLKSLANDSIIKCNINQVQGNEYRIQYTPTIRGRHELIISVNGQEVAGSPFPVFVSIPPTKLGEPVRVIETEMDKPFDLTVNSLREIIVTGAKTIEVYNMEGIQTRSIESSVYGINDPAGVTVDNADCIYITDYRRSKIVKLSKDMLLLKTYSSPQASEQGGVAVVGDKVMACDFKNNHIHVYTTKLEYIRQIGSPGTGPGQFNGIEDISSDQHGNLYVSDYFNSRIQVLDNGGKFLRLFDDNGNGLAMSGPCGVRVAGQYVYVVDWNNHDISVFTTEGVYVTSFGQWGGEVGDFDNPWGVFVDKEGFVYVCDYCNNRIQIF